MTETRTASSAVGFGRGGRMSRQRKRDAVLRLLRGEDLETVSRSLGVTAARLTSWRDLFLAAGEAAFGCPADGWRDARERAAEGSARRHAAQARTAGAKDRQPGGWAPFGTARSSHEPHDLPVQRPILWSRSGLPRLADRAQPSIATGLRHGQNRRGGAARWGRCRIRRCSPRSRPSSPGAHSTAKATARSGRGYVLLGCGPRSAGCYD